MKCDGCFRDVMTYYVVEGKKYCEVCYIPEKPNQTFDRLYNFIDVNTTGKPVEIRSKSQWRSHLKKLGLHDDIKQSPRKSTELFDSEKYFASQKQQRRIEMNNILREAIRKR